MNPDEKANTVDQMIKIIARRKRSNIRRQWPELAKLDDDIACMTDNIRHRCIALDQLREERKLLAKLHGVDNV